MNRSVLNVSCDIGQLEARACVCFSRAMNHDRLKKELQRVRRGDSAALIGVLDKYFPPSIVAQANNNGQPKRKKSKQEQAWEPRMAPISALPPEIAIMIFERMAFDERWIVGIVLGRPTSPQLSFFYEFVVRSLGMAIGENPRVDTTAQLQLGDPPAVRHVRAHLHVNIGIDGTDAEQFVDTAVLILSTLYEFISELRDPRALLDPVSRPLPRGVALRTGPYAKEEEDWFSLGGMVDTRLNYASNFPFQYLAVLSWQVLHVMDKLRLAKYAEVLPALLERLATQIQAPPQQLFDKLLLFLGGYPRSIRRLLWEHADSDAAWGLLLNYFDGLFFRRIIRLDPALPPLLVPSDLLLTTILASHGTTDAFISTYTEMYARARLSTSFEPYSLVAKWRAGQVIPQPAVLPEGYQLTAIVFLQIRIPLATDDALAMVASASLAWQVGLQAVRYDGDFDDNDRILDFFRSAFGPHDFALIEDANTEFIENLQTRERAGEEDIDEELWVGSIVQQETAEANVPLLGHWHIAPGDWLEEGWPFNQRATPSFPITALADVGRMLHMEKPHGEPVVQFAQRLLTPFGIFYSALRVLQMLIYQAAADSKAFDRLPWIIDPMERFHVLLVFNTLIMNHNIVSFDVGMRIALSRAIRLPTNTPQFTYFLESALRQRTGRWYPDGLYYGNPDTEGNLSTIPTAELSATDGMLLLLQQISQSFPLSRVARDPDIWSSFGLTGGVIESQWADVFQKEPSYTRKKGDPWNRAHASLYLPGDRIGVELIIDRIADDIMLVDHSHLDFAQLHLESTLLAGISNALDYALISVESWWTMWLLYHEHALRPTTLIAFMIFLAASPANVDSPLMNWKLHRADLQRVVDFVEERDRKGNFANTKLFQTIPDHAIDEDYPNRLFSARQTLYNIIHQRELEEDARQRKGAEPPLIFEIQRLIKAGLLEKTTVDLHDLRVVPRGMKGTLAERAQFWEDIEEETGWAKEMWPETLVFQWPDHIELHMRRDVTT